MAKNGQDGQGDINGDVHRANWGDKQAKTWWLVEPSILRIVQVLNRAKRSVSHGTNQGSSVKCPTKFQALNAAEDCE